MEFQSAQPSIVKSIKQRDLLNNWLRLYAPKQTIPHMSEYQPARIEDELPDLVFYTADTIANIDDIYGRIVAYERLLLPFSDGGSVTHIVASLKTISEDGGFEIKNLMRGNDKLPVPKLRAIIDRDLFHRAPGRIPSGDVLEFG